MIIDEEYIAYLEEEEQQHSSLPPQTDSEAYTQATDEVTASNETDAATAIPHQSQHTWDEIEEPEDTLGEGPIEEEEEETWIANDSKEPNNAPYIDQEIIEEDDDDDLLQDDNTTTPKKRRSSIGKLWQHMGGDMLSAPWLNRYKYVFVTLIVMFMFNTCNGYTFIEKVNTVDRYETRIKDLHYMHLSVVQELTQRSRMLDVEQRVRTQGLNLEIPSTPPFLLYRPQEDPKAKKSHE